MIVDIFNTDKKYDIIYADPPWEYKQSGSKTSSRGMAKQHYQTMSTDAIVGFRFKISKQIKLFVLCGRPFRIFSKP